MSKNIELEKFIKVLKKPSLNILFLQYESKGPNVDSHLGGLPYFNEGDKWPTCSKCGKDMDFFMQLREVNKEGKVNLNVFYNCSCSIKDYEPSINIIQYAEPDIKKCIEKVNKETKIGPYVEIKFEPSWSIPNWELLPYYNSEMYKKILEMNEDDSEKAEDYYETLRWNENLLAIEPYSLIRGYPEFISDPKVFKCHCCKEKTEFMFQIESDVEFGIDWNGGVLYCFKCPRKGTYYFFLN